MGKVSGNKNGFSSVWRPDTSVSYNSSFCKHGLCVEDVCPWETEGLFCCPTCYCLCLPSEWSTEVWDKCPWYHFKDECWDDSWFLSSNIMAFYSHRTGRQLLDKLIWERILVSVEIKDNVSYLWGLGVKQEKQKGRTEWRSRFKGSVTWSGSCLHSSRIDPILPWLS